MKRAAPRPPRQDAVRADKNEERVTIVTVKLSQPIEAYGEQVHTLKLKMKKMTLGDARILDDTSGEVDTAIHLISTFGDIPPASAEQIQLEDMDAINKAIAPFLRTGRRTGSR